MLIYEILISTGMSPTINYFIEIKIKNTHKNMLSTEK